MEIKLCRWCYEPSYNDGDECYECLHKDESTIVDREISRRQAKTLADKWASLQGW